MGKQLRTVSKALILGVAAALIARRASRGHRPSFAGKTVITGGSRGLGLAMARRFAAEDARLILVARSADQLEAAAEELREGGASVQTAVCDVRDREAVQRIIDTVIATNGRIDVLVNNAGVIQVTPFVHAQVSDFEDSLATHFWAPLFLITACLPHFMRQRAGRIVNISSIGGRIGVPHLSVSPQVS